MTWTILEYCEFSLRKVIEFYTKLELSRNENHTDENNETTLTPNNYHNEPFVPNEILLQSIFSTIDTIAAVSRNGNCPSFAHGDIKPDNIMFKVDRKSKKIFCHLIDFGTSGPDDTDDAAPRDYGVTKSYIPPNRLDSKDMDDFEFVSFKTTKEMNDVSMHLVESYSSKFTKSGCATKRLFGQGDDLWALSITTVEAWYKIHPITIVSKERWDQGSPKNTLEVIKEEDFLDHFKKSPVYKSILTTNDDNFNMILKDILVPGFDPEPKNRQDHFKKLIDGTSLELRNDKKFRHNLDMKVYKILKKIPEFKLFNLKN